MRSSFGKWNPMRVAGFLLVEISYNSIPGGIARFAFWLGIKPPFLDKGMNISIALIECSDRHKLARIHPARNSNFSAR